MAEFDLNNIKRRMNGALTALKQEFSGLRTGRANAALLDTVQVEAYGALTPLNQVGTVSVPESRMISVQIWDKGLVQAADKAIRNAGLGVNPVVDGQNLRIPIPALNEERRTELAKLASRYAEQARIAVRNVRRDGMDSLKAMEKNNELSEDEHKKNGALVQAATDGTIANIDQALGAKEEEIMQV
ncbi:MAG: ribosome recycling factor [Robiginitomaculum sp.]|nr:MAG: ribosome recycling factor [Robiginitomaculum sp.]